MCHGSHDSDVTHLTKCVITSSAKLTYVTIKLWQYKLLHFLVNSTFDSRRPRDGITLNNYFHDASNFIIVLNIYVDDCAVAHSMFQAKGVLITQATS